MATSDQFSNKDKAQLLEAELARKSLDDLQKPRKVGQKIGLGVVHDDLTRLDKDVQKLQKTLEGNEPTQGRGPLPVFSMGGQKLDPKNKDESAVMELIRKQHPELFEGQPEPEAPAKAAKERPQHEIKTVEQESFDETDADRTERLRKIGSTIEEKTIAEKGGSRNESLNTINKNVFDKFVEQTKERENLLKDASEEQHKIFQELEDTLTKLREAGTKESEELRKQLAELSGKLGETEDTGAKRKIQYQLDTARGNARPENLGNVAMAALGKENVLKKGYVREGDNIRNVETGKFASAKEAAHGKLASAGIMMGKFATGKIEKFVENQRSDRFQGFMDRNVYPKQGERKSELAAILEALKDLKPRDKNKPAASPSKGSAWAKSVSNMALATKVEADAAPVAAGQPNVSIGNIDNLTVNAKNVTVKGGKGEEEDSGFNLMDPSSWFGDKGKTSGKSTGGKGKAGVKGKAANRKMPARDPKTGRFVKNSTKASKAATASKVSKYGGRALAGVGGVLAGYSAYEENKDKRGKGTAAAIGVGTAGGAIAGAEAGAALGTMIFPGVGTVVGGVLGGALGAWGAQSAGEAVADATATPKVAAVPTTQGATIQRATAMNAEVKKDSKPVIIHAPQQAAATSQQSHSVMLPSPNVRTSESAFETYRNRGANFV